LIASIAAVVASVADLMMLSVVLISAPEVKVAPGVLLSVSAILGSIAIPFYALGYAAIARSFTSPAPGLRRTIVVSGIIVGVMGGILHAATAVFIWRSWESGLMVKPGDVLHSGLLLPMLWGLATAATLLASGALGFAVVAGKSSLRPVVAVLNPVVGTALIVSLVLVSGSKNLAEFLVPAAPNLAHVIFFFVACSVANMPRV